MGIILRAYSKKFLVKSGLHLRSLGILRYYAVFRGFAQSKFWVAEKNVQNRKHAQMCAKVRKMSVECGKYFNFEHQRRKIVRKFEFFSACASSRIIAEKTCGEAEACGWQRKSDQHCPPTIANFPTMYDVVRCHTHVAAYLTL